MRKKPIQEMLHPVIPGHSSSDLPCADFLSLSCYDPPAAQSVRMLTRVEPLEELGTWWLPAQQEDALGGSLFFSHGNQGIRLDLIGSFQPSESGMGDRKLESYPLIFGRLSSGSLVTLETCSTIEVREVGLVNTTVTEGIQAGHIYIGDHLPDGGGYYMPARRTQFRIAGYLGSSRWALRKSNAGKPCGSWQIPIPVSYTHLRAHETVLDLVC